MMAGTETESLQASVAIPRTSANRNKLAGMHAATHSVLEEHAMALCEKGSRCGGNPRGAASLLRRKTPDRAAPPRVARIKRV
jgi:hypothetical protein